MSGKTGAEQYFEKQLENPEYRAVFEEARAEIEAATQTVTYEVTVLADDLKAWWEGTTDDELSRFKYKGSQSTAGARITAAEFRAGARAELTRRGAEQ